jgi:large-conductance mechanosensitive channel
MAGDSIPYQALNLLGAICLIVNTFYYGAFPSTVVNLVWIAIAIFAINRHTPRSPQ